jgi:phosphoglycolate phosphatase-like HAD superfamily hydrolase
VSLPTLAIVDLDGPILDVAPRYFAAHQRALALAATAGVHTTLPAFWAARRRRLPPAQMVGDVMRANAYAEAFRKVLEDDALLGLDQLHPQALESLTRLTRTRETLVLTLRSNVAGARAQVARLGLDALCPIHFVIHTLAGKGARARQLASGRKVSAVVGDTEADAAVARVVGAPFVAVAAGIRDQEALAEETPAAIVDDLAAAVGWIEKYA